MMAEKKGVLGIHAVSRALQAKEAKIGKQENSE